MHKLEVERSKAHDYREQGGRLNQNQSRATGMQQKWYLKLKESSNLAAVFNR